MRGSVRALPEATATSTKAPTPASIAFHDELYVNDAKPGDPCPDCGRPTETVTEENYFFKLSALSGPPARIFTKREPNFIQPDTGATKLIAVRQGGLNDLSITRTTIKWGIPVPVEGNHVFYVWFDALTTYMSAVKGHRTCGPPICT